MYVTCSMVRLYLLALAMACWESMSVWKENIKNWGLEERLYQSDLASDSVPRNTAGPDHSSIAEVQSLGSSEHAGQAEAALVLSSRVPAEVGNHWEDNGVNTVDTPTTTTTSPPCSHLTLFKSWYLSESTLYSNYISLRQDNLHR